MPWKGDILAYLSDFQTGIAAIVGVFIRYLIRRNFSFREAMSGALTGVCSAYYLSPAIAEYFEVGPHGLSAIALIVGMVGHDLAVGVAKITRDFAKTGEVNYKIRAATDLPTKSKGDDNDRHNRNHNDDRD